MSPITVVTAAIIFKAGKVLIAQRTNGDWEFPGGKLEPPESLEACLIREIREELELEIDIERPFMTVDHHYPEKRIRLHSYLCRWRDGTAQANDHHRVLWTVIGALGEFSFAAADRPIVSRLLGSAANQPTGGPF
jgi:8-oxo-dGTP diphosphatase